MVVDLSGGVASPDDGLDFDDSPREECGVFAIFAPERDVARLTFFGLFAMQHRGQESAGIAVSDQSHIMVYKEMGLVSQVFKEQTLRSLSGQLAIGHVRYSTTGSSEWRNAQPIHRARNGSAIALAHNGNLVNTDELRARLVADGVELSSTSDTEIIGAMLAEHPAHDVKDALRDVIPQLRGAFSAVMLTESAVYGFRDPYGVRPLVLGRLVDRYVLASETAALDIIGAEAVREIEPGEMCWIDDEGYHVERVVARENEALCVFEFIYFARPDSVMRGQTLYSARSRMGEELAAESPADADLVIPVPDTGNSAAIGYSAASGIPFGEGLVKNRYVGRTFIEPDDDLRRLGIRMKLNPLKSTIRGKRLVVVDDSIVRGNTTSRLVRMLFDSGAAEVHLRISSPPIVFPCFYGIDMAGQGEFIAFERTVEEVARELGATSLAYLSLDGLIRATGLGRESFCTACFSGDYPCEVPEELRMSKFRYEGAKQAQ
ncbi:MAG: amidophosphoribosyltransferase [Thermoleophilia bacterium]